MSYSVQVVIPYLRFPWCIADCLESFRESDIPVLIVDNSPDSDLDFEKHPHYPGFIMSPNLEIVYYPKNIGVAASWNLGLLKGADQTIICSQWTRLSQTEEARVSERGLNTVVNHLQQYANDYGLEFGDQIYHLRSVGRRQVEEVGFFDENFYPDHGEDYDYETRKFLANAICAVWPYESESFKDSQIQSIAHRTHKRDGVNDEQLRMKSYNYFKWGTNRLGEPREYAHPFGNPNNPIQFWPEVKGGSGIDWQGKMMET